MGAREGRTITSLRHKEESGSGYLPRVSVSAGGGLGAGLENDVPFGPLNMVITS